MKDQLKVVIIGQYAEEMKNTIFLMTLKCHRQIRFVIKMRIFSFMRQSEEINLFI